MADRREHSIATPEAFAEAFDVSHETVERLKTYLDVLQRWQKAINLVSPTTLDSAWHRHFADSAQLLRLAPPSSARWLDLGSGAGFPGLVLAILLHEKGGNRVTLIESDQRKAAFLAEVARKTAVTVEILCDRIEKIATQDKVGPVDVVTARALAPLPRLFALSVPFFSSGTTGLFLKGRDAKAEIREAQADWSFGYVLEPSLTDPFARIAVISELHAKTEE